MTAALALILAPALTGALLLFIASQLDEEHFPFKLLLIAFALFSLVVMAQASYDAQKTCVMDVNETTRSGNTTHFTDTRTLSEYCTVTVADSSNTLLKQNLWLVRLSVLYFVVFFGYYTLEWLRENAKI